MPRNVEIKARVELDDIAARIEPIATDGPFSITQDDTFFACPAGRLKLRVTSAGHGELIYYARTNDHGPTVSSYVRSPTAEPDTLRECLTRGCGLAGRVRKQRTLYLVGRTRVHLDRVETLGEFLELEVVLEDDEPIGNGVREARQLMARLQVTPEQLIDLAYVDLLTAAAQSDDPGDTQS